MKTSKKQIAETWNAIARQYGGYRRKAFGPVDEFIKNSKARILDIGCGTATYLRSNDIGIDFAFEACKIASKKVNVICADATRLPIKPKSFSRILSQATVHHLPTSEDRNLFFSEIKRVLTLKGEALITALNRHKGDFFLLHFIKRNIILKWGKDIKRYYHLFTKRELHNLAKRVFSNFEIILQKGTKHKNLYLYVRK